MTLFLFQRLEKEENYKKSIEGHRGHVSKLEALMRSVDNDAIDIEKVKVKVSYVCQSDLNIILSQCFVTG